MFSSTSMNCSSGPLIPVSNQSFLSCPQPLQVHAHCFNTHWAGELWISYLQYLQFYQRLPDVSSSFHQPPQCLITFRKLAEVAQTSCLLDALCVPEVMNHTSRWRAAGHLEASMAKGDITQGWPHHCSRGGGACGTSLFLGTVFQAFLSVVCEWM